MKFIATPEQLRARLELRRSNASAKHVNKKKYTRKKKHVGKSTFWDQYDKISVSIISSKFIFSTSLSIP